MLHEPNASLQEHDIDLAVDRPFDQVWPTLERCASRRGFVPVWRAEYDVGGATYVMFARSDGLVVERLALDVLTDLDGIGKYGIPVRPLLRSRCTRDGLVYPSPAWEATYLIAKQVWKGHWRSPALARAARLATQDTQAFARAATVVFGRARAAALAERASSGRIIDSPKHARRLLRMIRVRRALRRPWLPVLFASRILHRASDPTGLFVAVCGPDGAGKSALTTALLRSVGPLYRRRSRMHWRPGLLPRLGAAVRRPTPDGRAPHGPEPYGRPISLVRFAYYWADHVVGYWAKVWPFRARSGFLVLERGYHDMLVDPVRYRMRIPAKVLKAAEALVPDPDITIVLVGEPSVLHARKAELDVDEIERQIERWRGLVPQIPRSHVVDVTRPFADVSASAVSLVLGASHDAPDRRRKTDPHSA